MFQVHECLSYEKVREGSGQGGSSNNATRIAGESGDEGGSGDENNAC